MRAVEEGKKWTCVSELMSHVAVADGCNEGMQGMVLVDNAHAINVVAHRPDGLERRCFAQYRGNTDRLGAQCCQRV